jgi:hypothetical protein
MRKSYSTSYQHYEVPKGKVVVRGQEGDGTGSNEEARRIILPGGVIVIPRREGPWTVCLPCRREGRLAGPARETAGASEGGGRLERARGAAEAASLGLAGGFDGPTLVRLTCGLGTGLTEPEAQAGREGAATGARGRESNKLATVNPPSTLSERTFLSRRSDCRPVSIVPRNLGVSAWSILRAARAVSKLRKYASQSTDWEGAGEAVALSNSEPVTGGVGLM